MTYWPLALPVVLALVTLTVLARRRGLRSYTPAVGTLEGEVAGRPGELFRAFVFPAFTARQATGHPLVPRIGAAYRPGSPFRCERVETQAIGEGLFRVVARYRVPDAPPPSAE